RMTGMIPTSPIFKTTSSIVIKNVWDFSAQSSQLTISSPEELLLMSPLRYRRALSSQARRERHHIPQPTAGLFLSESHRSNPRQKNRILQLGRKFRGFRVVEAGRTCPRYSRLHSSHCK